jgi:hypothetical protein
MIDLTMAETNYLKRSLKSLDDLKRFLCKFAKSGQLHRMRFIATSRKQNSSLEI